MRTLKFIAVLLLLATTAQGQDLKFLLLKGDIATMRRYDSAAVKAAINAKLSASDTASMLSAYQTSINSKQATLVNGTNLKSVNGNSLLGSGNLTISSSITSGDVTTALGYTPYNSTNPSGYISSVPAQSFASLTGKPTTLSGYGITDAYPLTGNPSSFLTSSALSPYLTIATAASTYQPIGSYLTAASITGKVNYTDTSSMLSAYSTAINTKQNTLVAGTDYLTPTGSAASLTSFPTFNQNTTGSAAGLSTGRTISISGDLAYTSPTFNGTSNVSAASTLATVNSNVGSFGSATQVPSYTVNAKGLITSASNTTIQIPESQVTNLTTDLAAKQDALTLTTTGTSGAATLVGNTLNIPSYSGGGAAWGGITGTLSSQTDLQTALDAKQATLVSATNIKTINGNSIVGSGDLTISIGDALYNNQALYHIPSGFQDATFTSIGGTMTAVGTPAAVNWANTDIRTRTKRIRMASAATAGALTEQRSRNFLVSGGNGTNWGFEFKCKFSPSNAAAVSGERFFCGVITSAGIAATNVEPSTLVNCVGIAKLSTDNTQFYIVYAGTTAQTPIALGTAVGSPSASATDLFEVKINSPKSPATTYIVTLTNISTGVVVTQTVSGTSVQVPASTVGLGCKIYKTNNTTAIAVAFDLAGIMLSPNL